MENFAIFFMLASSLAFFVGRIWFLIESFRASIWWGLGVLFIPFVDLIFLFTHWQEVSRPVFLQLFAILLALIPFLFEKPECVLKTYSCSSTISVH